MDAGQVRCLTLIALLTIEAATQSPIAPTAMGSGRNTTLAAQSRTSTEVTAGPLHLSAELAFMYA